MDDEHRKKLTILTAIGTIFLLLAIFENYYHFSTHMYCTIDSFDGRECYEKKAQYNFRLLLTINDGSAMATAECGPVMNCTSSPCNYDYVKGETYYCDPKSKGNEHLYTLHSNIFEADWSLYRFSLMFGFIGAVIGLPPTIMIANEYMTRIIN